jgi:hypothetical protein
MTPRGWLPLLLLPCVDAFVAGVGTVQMHPHASISAKRIAMDAGPCTVKHFIKDLEFLGPCRFVVVGPGAILEAIGAFESLREKNGLVTVSNDDNTFECHLRLSEISAAQFATKEGANGRQMHIVRLLGGTERKTMLSAILHPEDGDEVDPGAIEFWDSLRQRFGDEVELAAEA